MLRRGVITLVFDDGYTSVKKNVVPELDKNRIPGVFAIPLNNEQLQRENAPSTEPWQSWLPLRQTGHELAAHTIDHVDLTTLSEAERKPQLKTPAQSLNASTVVYPGGACNNSVVEQARQYYQAGRTVKTGTETLPPADPMRLKTYNFTRKNYSVLKANLLALWAWLTNSWLIETYHEVTDAESDYLHTVPLADFKDHLKFITKLPIRIQTISKTLSTP